MGGLVRWLDLQSPSSDWISNWCSKKNFLKTNRIFFLKLICKTILLSVTRQSERITRRKATPWSYQKYYTLNDRINTTDKSVNCSSSNSNRSGQKDKYHHGEKHSKKFHRNHIGKSTHDLADRWSQSKARKMTRNSYSSDSEINKTLRARLDIENKLDISI